MIDLVHTAATAQWQKVGARSHHGVCIPLFSLHSEKSCGIGEYYDLLPMIQWCKEVGLDIIQLLPLNDMGLETSPYNAISSCALNPIHLSLTELHNIALVPQHEEKLSKLSYWNRTSRIKYHIVRELKFAFLREYFSCIFSAIEPSSAYQTFVEKNPWLSSYALFKTLKEIHFWKSWEDWPNLLKSPSEKGYAELLKEHHKSCDFHIFLQFLCYQQLEAVKRNATEKGVFLKGDIPILISRDSSDVWHQRHLFLLNFAAGAPPDVYSREGQHWGFPLFDWEELEKYDYNWWRERLRVATGLYDLYRIDHVVGFFRMWAIASGKPPREGSFLPPHQEQWIPQGRKLMEMLLKSSPMLPIGEDLGLVPPEVKECLRQLGICGTRVIRWERRWDGDGGYIPFQEYHPLSMTTVSTHDSDTLQLWWRHFPKDAKLFADFMGWSYKPFLSNEYHERILYDAHHTPSHFHINLLGEYLALFPELVAANPHHERINIPGKVLQTNWTYRFKPSVEKIIKHTPLREKIRSLIS